MPVSLVDCGRGKAKPMTLTRGSPSCPPPPLLSSLQPNTLSHRVYNSLLRITFNRSYHSTTPLYKRQFTRIEPVKMDLPSLESRISQLSLSTSTSTSTDSSTPLLSYFFTPKSGSKHPDNAEQDLKLVLVALEEGKNLGAAKAVATQAGLKDMRALSGADLDTLIGRKRDEGELRCPRLDTLLFCRGRVESSGQLKRDCRGPQGLRGVSFASMPVARWSCQRKRVPEASALFSSCNRAGTSRAVVDQGGLQ